MSSDTELTAYLLRYLHDNHYFQTMEEMAEAFGISKRQIQRLVNNADMLKGGSIALNKILQYFGRHHIPFDPVLIEFVSNTARRDEIEKLQLEKPYMRINLPFTEDLTEEGVAAYEYCRKYIGLVSSFLCTDCQSWCNPWDGIVKIQDQQCMLSQLAEAMLQTVATTYAKRK